MAKFSKGWAFVGMSVATSLAFAIGCSQSSDLTDSSAANETAGSGLVISQVYGGGGNRGATFKNDFVELFNHGTTDVTLDGKLSLQYVNAKNAFSKTADNALMKLDSGKTIKPGQSYLVKLAGGGADGGTPDPVSQDLPASDQEGSLNLGKESGKIAIVSTDDALDACGTTTGGATLCPAAKYIDLVGYGTDASQFEGSGAAPALDNITSAARTAADGTPSGCAATGDNAADFKKLTPPKPRSLADAAIVCLAASDAGADADAAADTGADAGDGGNGHTDAGDGGGNHPPRDAGNDAAEGGGPRPHPDAAPSGDDDDDNAVEEQTGDQPKPKPAPKAPLRNGSSSCSASPAGTDMGGGMSALFGLALVAASFRARRKK